MSDDRKRRLHRFAKAVWREAQDGYAIPYSPNMCAPLVDALAAEIDAEVQAARCPNHGPDAIEAAE